MKHTPEVTTVLAIVARGFQNMVSGTRSLFSMLSALGESTALVLIIVSL